MEVGWQLLDLGCCGWNRRRPWTQIETVHETKCKLRSWSEPCTSLVKVFCQFSADECRSDSVCGSIWIWSYTPVSHVGTWLLRLSRNYFKWSDVHIEKFQPTKHTNIIIEYQIKNDSPNSQMKNIYMRAHLKIHLKDPPSTLHRKLAKVWKCTAEKEAPAIFKLRLLRLSAVVEEEGEVQI